MCCWIYKEYSVQCFITMEDYLKELHRVNPHSHNFGQCYDCSAPCASCKECGMTTAVTPFEACTCEHKDDVKCKCEWDDQPIETGADAGTQTVQLDIENYRKVIEETVGLTLGGDEDDETFAKVFLPWSVRYNDQKEEEEQVMPDTKKLMKQLLGKGRTVAAARVNAKKTTSIPKRKEPDQKVVNELKEKQKKDTGERERDLMEEFLGKKRTVKISQEEKDPSQDVDEISALRTENARLQSQLHETRNVGVDRNLEEELRNDKADLAQELATAKAKLADVERNGEGTLRDAKAALEEKLEQLRNANASLKEQLGRAGETSSDKLAELQLIEKALGKPPGADESNVEAINGLQSAKKRLEAEVSKLGLQVAQLEADKVRSGNSKSNSVNALEVEIDSLRKEKQDAASALDEAKKNAEARLSALSTELLTAKDDKTRAETRLSELRGQLQTISETDKAELGKLQSELEANKETLTQVRDELNSEKSKSAEAERDLSQVREELTLEKSKTAEAQSAVVPEIGIIRDDSVNALLSDDSFGDAIDQLDQSYDYEPKSVEDEQEPEPVSLTPFEMNDDWTPSQRKVIDGIFDLDQGNLGKIGTVSSSIPGVIKRLDIEAAKGAGSSTVNYNKILDYMVDNNHITTERRDELRL